MSEAGWLHSPALGLDPGRTRLGLLLLGVLVAGAVAVRGVPAAVLTNDSHRVALWLFNGFSGVVLFATLAATPAAIGYGLWNGGPVLAGSIPAGPVALSQLLGGQVVVTVDLVLVIAGGSVAAVAATVRTLLFAARRGDDGTYSSAITAGIAVSTGGVVTATAWLWRLAETVGDHVEGGLLAANALVVLAFGGLCLVALLLAVPDLSSRLDPAGR